MSIEDLLTPHQLGVASQVLAEESARRAHLVVHLSGAHAYGFPSPDSDLDLKAVHVAATRSLLGLHPPRPTFDRAEIVDGVEIDYTSNEIGHVLAGAARQRQFSRTNPGDDDGVLRSPTEGLQPIVRRALHRRFHAHYRGFAVSNART
ncbi:MAG: nucleotidyltransferase domain-containing protein [Deltaproteobacteria bacterium]|nr:nucleotidyltransferase domain-containing protein [Deltaproteobacteria bacterium]